jgi:A/G-specific adenine glycosylase
MLQQTQASRVVEPYTRFIKRFPDAASLARASFRDVYTLWSGLGYNRRARYLKAAAEKIVREYNGKVPDTRKELLLLPGVGPYTAGAVLTFAFDRREPLIETNIRTVFIHFFFPGRSRVSDAELLPYIEKTLPLKDLRIWFNALMDYGAMLKETKENAGARSAHYVKQKAFKGSRRELRGKILKTLLKEQGMTRQALMRKIGADGTPHDVNGILDGLERDALIKKRKGVIALA